MLSLVSYYLQCRTRYLGQCEEIERNCTRLQNFDICFCVLFNCCCCCWNITSGREIEHRALPKPKLDIFLIFPNFYWSKVLSCLIYGGRDGKLCWNWTKIRKLGCQNLFIIKIFFVLTCQLLPAMSERVFRAAWGNWVKFYKTTRFRYLLLRSF